MRVYELRFKADNVSYENGKYILNEPEWPSYLSRSNRWRDTDGNIISHNDSRTWKRNGKSVGIQFVDWESQGKTLLTNRRGVISSFQLPFTPAYVPSYCLADDELTFAVLEAGGRKLWVFDVE